MKTLIALLVLIPALAWGGDQTLTQEGIFIWQDSLITSDEDVEIQELIDILEKARPHVWNEQVPYGITTLQVDHCVTDPICMAERELAKMKERKALSKRIEAVLRILKEAAK